MLCKLSCPILLYILHFNFPGQIENVQEFGKPDSTYTGILGQDCLRGYLHPFSLSTFLYPVFFSLFLNSFFLFSLSLLSLSSSLFSFFDNPYSFFLSLFILHLRQHYIFHFALTSNLFTFLFFFIHSVCPLIFIFFTYIFPFVIFRFNVFFLSFFSVEIILFVSFYLLSLLRTCSKINSSLVFFHCLLASNSFSLVLLARYFSIFFCSSA
jgi:hypothetical protein